MLKILQPSGWRPKLTAAHAGLALAVLMCALPFLHYRHQNPITTFDQEWWSAILGLLALALALAGTFRQAQDIPRITQLPAALILVVLLQLALGKIAYFNQALLYTMYFLFAALMMLLGARLRERFGMERVSSALAVGLLAGAELNAMIGFLQHYQLHSPLDPLVVLQVASSMYGNLAQPNHFADYIALGLISLGLLFQVGALRPGFATLLAVPLLLALTLSGSRAAWLYVVLMVCLAWLMGRRNVSMRPLLRYSGLLLVVFAIMNLFAHALFVTGADTGTDTLQRLVAENAGAHANDMARLYLWREAWLIFAQSPWAGVGFGQFAWHHFQMLPVLRGSNILGFYNNTHNLISQLAAESGLAGLLALFIPLGMWAYGLRHATPRPAYWWGYAVLGVMAVHSMLEYPLWYAYFLAVASLLLGMLDERRYRVVAPVLWRLSLLLILGLGFLSLVHLRNDFGRIKGPSAIEQADDAASQKIRENLLAVQRSSLLSPYSEMLIMSLAEVSPDHIKQKIALGNNVMHFAPIAPVVYRQAYFLAEDGQLDAAKRLIEEAIWSYPGNKEARGQLLALAEKDPAHFSGLLEFANHIEQERASAVRQ